MKKNQYSLWINIFELYAFFEYEKGRVYMNFSVSSWFKDEDFGSVRTEGCNQ